MVYQSFFCFVTMQAFDTRTDRQTDGHLSRRSTQRGTIMNLLLDNS